MKHFLHPAFLMFFIFIIGCAEKLENKALDNRIVVTYIANEGFLLESNGRKVLIDALFNTGQDRYAYPDSLLVTEMVSGNPPFDNIDYLMFTHHHPDHYNDSLAYAFLLRHPKTKMICTNQVFDQLKNYHNLDSEIKKRIIAVTPDSGKVKTRKFEDLKITLCRTGHGDAFEIENNAIVIDFGGVKVFHSGDSWKEAMYEWKSIDLREDSIDLALVNAFYAGDGYELLNEKVAPKEIILIHMKNEHLDMFTDIMARDTAIFYNSTLFKYSMQSKTYDFYNDNLNISNR